MRDGGNGVRRETEEYPLDLLHKAAGLGLGLTCYDLPAEYGGGGITGLRDRCAVIEELSWGDSPILWVIAQGSFSPGRSSRWGARSRRSVGCRPGAALSPGLLGRDHGARLLGPRADARRRGLRARLAGSEVAVRREARRDLGRDERHHAADRRA